MGIKELRKRVDDRAKRMELNNRHLSNPDSTGISNASDRKSYLHSIRHMKAADEIGLLMAESAYYLALLEKGGYGLVTDGVQWAVGDPHRPRQDGCAF